MDAHGIGTDAMHSGAFLAARALIETVAVLMDLDWRLKILLDKGDLDGIDALIMNRFFSTRHDTLIRDTPDVKAVNVITIIECIAKKHELGGMLKQYHADFSEFCHPNFGGHLGLFGVMNGEAYETTYAC